MIPISSQTTIFLKGSPPLFYGFFAALLRIYHKYKKKATPAAQLFCRKIAHKNSLLGLSPSKHRPKRRSHAQANSSCLLSLLQPFAQRQPQHSHAGENRKRKHPPGLRIVSGPRHRFWHRGGHCPLEVRDQVIACACCKVDPLRSGERSTFLRPVDERVNWMGLGVVSDSLRKDLLLHFFISHQTNIRGGIPLPRRPGCLPVSKTKSVIPAQRPRTTQNYATRQNYPAPQGLSRCRWQCP